MRRTPREQELLELLYARYPEPVPGRAIVAATVGEPAGPNYARCLVSRLRRKLPPGCRVEATPQLRDRFGHYPGRFGSGPGFRLVMADAV
jgi:DNA-binding response OmpR family regulator